ncbi:MAG: glycosyltransferase [Pseudomonadota bacterium]
MTAPTPASSAPASSAPAAPALRSGRPLLTLFVMAYRQRGLVDAAVASALAQDWRPLEIVLSDDASPDGTGERLEELAAAYKGPHAVRVNRNPRNTGLTAHLDRIMQIAEGALLIQNAGDDLSEPDRASRLFEAWDGGGRRAHLIHTPATIIDESGAVVGRKDALAPMRRDPACGPDAARIIARSLYALGAASAWTPRLQQVFGPLGVLGVEDTVIPLRAAALGAAERRAQETGPGAGLLFVDAPLTRWRAGGLSWSAREDRRGADYFAPTRRKILGWHALSHARIAEDLERLDFPGRDAARAINAARRARLGLEIDLFDRGPLGRLAAGPRALGLSLARRDATYLRDWAKHAARPVYARYLDRTYRPEQLRW